jgi:hypothetical protein
LGSTLSELLVPLLKHRLEQVLDETSIGFVIIGNESNDTIWKARINSKDCRIGNVSSDGDAHRPCWPDAALSKPSLTVRLGVVGQVEASMFDISGLNEWVWPTI